MESIFCCFNITGVARAGNPGFQKNIQEQQQNRRQQLIEALNAKYGHERAQQELGLRGREVAKSESEEKELERHNPIMEAQGLAEAGARTKAAGAEAAGRTLAATPWYRSLLGLGPTEEAQQAIEGIKKATGLSPSAGAKKTAAPSPVKLTSRAQFNSLPKGATFTDDSGKVKVKH